jgi:hypothetical protein
MSENLKLPLTHRAPRARAPEMLRDVEAASARTSMPENLKPPSTRRAPQARASTVRGMLQDVEALRRHFAAADAAALGTRPGAPPPAKVARLVLRAARQAKYVPKSYPLSADLGRLSVAIERDGFGAPQAEELARLAAHAAAVEAETGEPVGTNLASTVAAAMDLHGIRRAPTEPAHETSVAEGRRAELSRLTILGLRQLRHALDYAKASTHPSAPALVSQLAAIADHIETDGWVSGSERTRDWLRRLNALALKAAEIERRGERPMTRHLEKAIWRLSRHEPAEPMSAQAWARWTLWKKRHLRRASAVRPPRAE